MLSIHDDSDWHLRKEGMEQMGSKGNRRGFISPSTYGKTDICCVWLAGHRGVCYILCCFWLAHFSSTIKMASWRSTALGSCLPQPLGCGTEESHHRHVAGVAFSPLRAEHAVWSTGRDLSKLVSGSNLNLGPGIQCKSKVTHDFKSRMGLPWWSRG